MTWAVTIPNPVNFDRCTRGLPRNYAWLRQQEGENSLKMRRETEPRLAVAYHFFNDFDTVPASLRDNRMTFHGPLALAVDYMVFNVTRDDIKVRMAAADEDIWPQPSTIPLVPPDPKLQRTQMSDFTRGGRIVHRDVLEDVYRYINEKFGSNEQVP